MMHSMKPNPLQRNWFVVVGAGDDVADAVDDVDANAHGHADVRDGPDDAIVEYDDDASFQLPFDDD